jgi:lipopolysaccharide export LptBFGC system permease protein LptF
LDKYIEIIQEQKINSVILKQTKTEDNQIERDIFKIYKYEKKNNIPIYSQEKINKIKKEYYNETLSKKSKNIEKVKKEDKSIEKQFLDDFKTRDFTNKTYYELIEYMIKWKNILGIEKF